MKDNEKKYLADLVKAAGVDCDCGRELAGTVISSLAVDSRKVRPGSLFVAISGAACDGHDYMEEAVAKGCTAVLAERKPEATLDVPVICVPDTRNILGYLAAAFYDFPAEEAVLIGITGTNGKTTTTWLIEGILKECGFSPGVIGTVNIRYAGQERASRLTTPEPLELQKTLRAMIDKGVSHVVMEVSSHALDQGRVNGLSFDVALFTNLSRDHLDYHADMGGYFDAKKRLFTHYLKTTGTAVVNLGADTPGIQRRKRSKEISSGERPWGSELAFYLQELHVGCTLTCGIEEGQISAINPAYSLAGITAEITFPDGEFQLRSQLVGKFNLSNLLSAAAVGAAIGLSPENIERGLHKVEAIPGRLERISATDNRSVAAFSGEDRFCPEIADRYGQPPASGVISAEKKPVFFIDYAHTPDALQQVLMTLKPLVDKRLIVVFGCGGDRDKGKRPLMGEVAGRLGDVVIVTSDNPRSEAPESILHDIEKGFADLSIKRVGLEELRRNPNARNGSSWNGKQVEETVDTIYSVIADRGMAIRKAIALSHPGDAVVICGKGHESTQTGRFGTIFFDDRLESIKALNLQRRII